MAYGDDGWFGVDGYPAKIIRVKLGNNLMTGCPPITTAVLQGTNEE